MLEVIKEQPNAPDAQFEAARLYQDWGTSGAPDAWKKLETALYGKQDADPKVWGWGYAAQSLQRAAANPGADPKLQELHFQARYHLVETERELGKAHPENAEAIKHLERARAAIVNFLRISPRWPDEEYTRFNSLYRQVLGDLGDAVVDLPREASGAGGIAAAGGGGASQAQVASAVSLPQVAPDAPPAESNKLLMLLVLMGGGVAVAGLFYVALNQGKAHRPKYDVDLSKPRETKAPKLANIAIGESTDVSLEGVAIATKKKLRPAGQKPAANAPTRPAAAAGGQPQSAAGQPVRKVRPADPAQQKRPPQAEGQPRQRPAAGPEGARPAPQRPAGDGGTPPQKRPRPKPPTEPSAE